MRQFFYQTEFQPISKRQFETSDKYFEYTSCNFKVVTLFIRNSFRVRLPYLLLIRRLMMMKDALCCKHNRALLF
jgi:hypothetical protein